MALFCNNSMMIGLIGLLASAVMVQPAFSARDQDRAREEFNAGHVQSFGQIKKRLEGQFRGRVLDVQIMPGNQGPTYDVKMLTKDGDVIVVETDAQTGRVLSVRGGGR